MLIFKMFLTKTNLSFASSILETTAQKIVPFKNALIGLILVILFAPSYGEYISHYHQHNFTCVDWKRAPEAAAGNCTRYGKYGALRCFGGMNNLPTMTEQKVRKLEEIILCGWPEKIFNPLIDLQPFPKIRALTIEYSGLTEIVFDFPEMFYLQTINISWTNLSHVNSRTFKRIHTLKVVDLRWNQLIQLDGPLLLPRFFEKLYLAGNPWNCTRNFKWLLIPEKSSFIADKNELICNDRKYKDRHLMTVMKYKVILKNECQSHIDLENCTCTMHHIIPKTHTPLYTVNCSNLQLERLPSYLPPNTTTLFANGNLISDVLPLSNNIHYRYVVDVHLDNNRIESIDELEGGYWLENFRLLSLRGNLLENIPVYAIDNALEDNANANLLLLSRNPWHCTCKFAMRFREVLSKYHSILRDAWNVTCTYSQDEQIRVANVLSIVRQDVCEAHHEQKVYPLDILNGVLISDVLPLSNNIHYRYVVDVHLDNNRIESIDELEGGYWLENFRLLSLRGNLLENIPVYAIDNALEDNANANLLLLSRNPWHCTCKFAMRFREVLSKYHSILRDAWNVTCTYSQDEQIRVANVLSIVRQDVCEAHHEQKVYPLDILNGVLVSLIVFILGKLAYDYYYYKYYGRVPWIVMKLP